MMRFQTTSSLVFAGLIGIPAIASQQDGSLESLEAALKSTQEAIVEVMGLQERLASKDPDALETLESVTERPVAATATTVDHIIVLQQEIDNLRRTEVEQIAGTAPLPLVKSKAPVASAPDTRVGVPQVPAYSPPEIHGLQRAEQSVAIEKEGYSLDDIRRGKLLVRANRSAEAIKVLSGKTGSPEGSYWLARALQGTGDTDGALELYNELEANESAGVFQGWAAQERAMIELRKRLKGTTKTKASPK